MAQQLFHHKCLHANVSSGRVDGWISLIKWRERHWKSTHSFMSSTWSQFFARHHHFYSKSSFLYASVSNNGTKEISIKHFGWIGKFTEREENFAFGEDLFLVPFAYRAKLHRLVQCERIKEVSKWCHVAQRIISYLSYAEMHLIR